MQTKISYWDSSSLTLCPMGDLQFGPNNVDGGRIKRHIDWCMEQPNPWFIGLGDYCDVASPSNRQKIKGAGLYDSVHEALEEIAEEHRLRLLEILEPTTGQWLGLLEGHHYYSFPDGSTTDTRLAEDLKTVHLGTSTLIRLQQPNGQAQCTIYATHGSGSGVSAAAPVTKLERSERGFEADVYLMGHMSKKVVAPIDKMAMDRNGRLFHKTKMLVGCGGFAQGYMQGSTQGKVPRGSYVEQGMMTPVVLGAPVVNIQWAKGRLDIHASV